MTKKLDREDFITFEKIFYDPNKKIKRQQKWNDEPTAYEQSIPREPNRRDKREGEELEESKLKGIFGDPNRQLILQFPEELNQKKLCESMVSDYPDDFYMYENYLIFLNYLFRFGDVESHLEQFDDDLKNKVLDFYRKNIPKTDLLSFME